MGLRNLSRRAFLHISTSSDLASEVPTPVVVGQPRSGRKRAVAAALFATSLVVTACSARPGDAPTVEDPQAEERAASTSQTNGEAQAKAEKKAQEEARRVIRVGVDSFTGNLNPHLEGNVDPVVSAISDLTLPSVFSSGPGGWVLDSNLMESVEPDDPHAPTKVTYKVASAAQWSDGTPITVSDFQYLAQVMVDEPAAAESGLYQHIKSIDTTVSSTEFTVQFNQPFSSWNRLFHHLLPSHIYRGENRPFAEMMRESSAASGGAYTLKSIDAGRGTAELQRNDRYWGDNPAETDRILFTSVPDVNTGAQMLRTKQINMLVQQAESTTELTLNQLQDVQQRSVIRPVQLNLVLNTQKSSLSNVATRAAVLKAIRAREIGQIVSQDMDAEEPAWQISAEDIQLHAGTEARTDATMPTKDNPLVIAAPQEDSKAVVAARTVADQLSQAGIPAKAVQQDQVELLSRTDSADAPDAIILWQYSPNDLGDYLSQFQCSPDELESTSTATPAPESGDATGGTNGATADTSTEPAPSTVDHFVLKGGGNISGDCDPEINRLLLDLESGHKNMREQRGELNALIAQQAIVQPLLGSRASVARASVLKGPSNDLSDWPITSSAGIFASASRWFIDNREPTPTESTAQPTGTEVAATDNKSDN